VSRIFIIIIFYFSLTPPDVPEWAGVLHGRAMGRHVLLELGLQVAPQPEYALQRVLRQLTIDVIEISRLSLLDSLLVSFDSSHEVNIYIPLTLYPRRGSKDRYSSEMPVLPKSPSYEEYCRRCALVVNPSPSDRSLSQA
jgi:hypothetical protein